VPTTLKLGAFTPSVVLAVARRTGSLAEQDLEVEEVLVPSSPAQFRSLASGELDLALTSPDNVVAYRFDPGNPLGATMDARVVGAVDRGMGLALYGRPGVDSAEQLRGAGVGVDVATSGFALAMYALGDSVGVGRDDYHLLTLGSTPKRLQALLEGSCDFTMLNAGNELTAEEAGCIPLVSAAKVCAPYLGTVLAVTDPAHLDPAERLMCGLRSAIDQILGNQVDALATEVAADLLHLPPPLATRYLERMKNPEEGLIPGGQVPLAALETIVRLRRHYLPRLVDGADVYATALEPDAGLLATSPAS
jgi:ABC-type nitrate/sulfonate/bicarbonate transport system substrate-binding protein